MVNGTHFSAEVDQTWNRHSRPCQHFGHHRRHFGALDVMQVDHVHVFDFPDYLRRLCPCNRYDDLCTGNRAIIVSVFWDKKKTKNKIIFESLECECFGDSIDNLNKNTSIDRTITFCIRRDTYQTEKMFCSSSKVLSNVSARHKRHVFELWNVRFNLGLMHTLTQQS